MFNITLDTSLISVINATSAILAPLILVGLWGFGLGCLAKAMLVVALRLVATCSSGEEPMSLDMALWHAEMAMLEDFDPSEFEVGLTESEEEEDIILLTFGTEDLTKWEPGGLPYNQYVASIGLAGILDDHYDFGDIAASFWPVVE